MWVIKLGGSLYESHCLPGWLHQLATLEAGKAVIVPGGGPFADQVRHAQNRWEISDPCAHAMALLAMEQFGYLLQGLEPRLCLAASRKEIKAILSRRQTPIWLPATELLDQPEIPKNWEVTSDSLAVWLSGKLKASRLVLIKKVQLSEPVISVHSLVTRGIVDAAFPHFLHSITVPCYCITADNYPQIALKNVVNMGTRIFPD
ncbi:amino acid kinase [Nitrosococcus watsonii]|uniref:Amino acid kinase family protein n=1 Tax=Nitrosococcus watsoni (strain C-113) TaxID=105559 RepID=D8K9N3_NITWC|nr:amino acid kinase [Nitrosococcus watsonii]ADJ27322.1 amino acid kinase family protein [Nitrosococcus watsonii C-113]